MNYTPSIVFVCPHGAAKSVIAAAYCQRLAHERGIPVQASAAGTEPEPIVSPLVVATLDGEGIDVAGYQPQLVTRTAVANAWRVVTLGARDH